MITRPLLIQLKEVVEKSDNLFRDCEGKSILRRIEEKEEEFSLEELRFVRDCLEKAHQKINSGTTSGV